MSAHSTAAVDTAAVDDPAGDAPEGGERGSRRERKKARTRRAIFRAAMTLFEQHGFEGVTVDRICEAADVAKGTFFLHFPTKSALLGEFGRELAAGLADRLREPRRSALAEYRTMVEYLGDRWLAQADVMRAMLREFLATPETVASAGSASRDLGTVVEDIVARGQRRGEFRRNVSPRLAAAMFLTTSAAILAGGVYGEDETTPEQVRNELLHALLHGLLEPKTRLVWSPSKPSNPSNAQEFR